MLDAALTGVMPPASQAGCRRFDAARTVIKSYNGGAIRQGVSKRA